MCGGNRTRISPLVKGTLYPLSYNRYLEPILEVGIQFEGHGVFKRLSMMRIMARRMKAATLLV